LKTPPKEGFFIMFIIKLIVVLTASLIEKFLNTMNLDYEIKISRSYRDSMGRKSVCIIVTVFRTKPEYKKEYIENHCYQLNRKNNVVYDQGNTEMGVGSGLLAYFGDNEAIDNYFDGLARDKAKEFFDEELKII
jgi:hypothetical protein